MALEVLRPTHRSVQQRHVWVQGSPSQSSWVVLDRSAERGRPLTALRRPAHVGEDLPVLVLLHQHREAWDLLEAEALGNARVGVGLDLGIALTGNLLPLACGLLNLKVHHCRFEDYPNDGLLGRGWLREARRASQNLPAVPQGPGGQLIFVHQADLPCAWLFLWPRWGADTSTKSSQAIEQVLTGARLLPR